MKIDDINEMNIKWRLAFNKPETEFALLVEIDAVVVVAVTGLLPVILVVVVGAAVVVVVGLVVEVVVVGVVVVFTPGLLQLSELQHTYTYSYESCTAASTHESLQPTKSIAALSHRSEVDGLTNH